MLHRDTHNEKHYVITHKQSGRSTTPSKLTSKRRAITLFTAYARLDWSKVAYDGSCGEWFREELRRLYMQVEHGLCTVGSHRKRVINA